MTPNLDLRIMGRWLEIALGAIFAVMTALIFLNSVFGYGQGQGQGQSLLALAAGLLATGFWIPSAGWPKAWIIPRMITRMGAIATGVFFLSVA